MSNYTFALVCFGGFHILFLIINVTSGSGRDGKQPVLVRSPKLSITGRVLGKDGENHLSPGAPLLLEPEGEKERERERERGGKIYDYKFVGTI